MIAISFCMLLLCLGIKAKAEIKYRYKPLSGLRIVLDPGHGGKDDGARASGIKEQEINLKIALKLQIHLQEAGAEVTLTRDGDYDLASEGAKNRKREDMKKRVDLINDEANDLFLSIHLNAYPNTNIKGAQAFYEKDNENAHAFADIIQNHLNILTNRELSSKTGDYYILNNTEKVGVLVECGFLSNDQDRANLLQEDYQEKLALLLSDSIKEYLKIMD